MQKREKVLYCYRSAAFPKQRIHGVMMMKSNGKKEKRVLSKAEQKKTVRFFIARRPYMEPAFNKNKQKTLALLQ